MIDLERDLPDPFGCASFVRSRLGAIALLAQGRLFVRCSPCAFLFISNLQKNEKQPRSPASGPTFAKRLTIPPEKLKIQAISKEIWGRRVLPRRLQESIIWALVFLPHNDMTLDSDALPKPADTNKSILQRGARSRYRPVFERPAE